MNLAPTIAGIALATVITFGGISGGIVGQGVLAEQHAAQVAAWQANIEADAAREHAAFDRFVAADTSFRGNTISAASALIESAHGRASEASIQALRDAIDLYIIPDNDPRGTVLIHAQARAERVAGPVIESAIETVAAEISAWQAAEDARVAAEAETARVAVEEAEAARQAEAQRSSSNPSSGNTSSNASSSSSSSDTASESNSSSSSSSSGGFDPQSAVQSAGCSFEWTDSGTSKGGGGPGGGCWVRISTSLSGDRLWMTVWHEIAHGRLFSQSAACNDAQKSVGIEVSANWWTNTYQGFTVPQYGYPNSDGVALLAANCGW